MKVVVHEAVPQDFREIDPGKMKDQPLQCVLVRTIKGKSGQGGTGDNVVDGRGFGHKESGNAGHGDLRFGGVDAGMGRSGFCLAGVKRDDQYYLPVPLSRPKKATSNKRKKRD
jgi:hypothetical protein